MPDLNYASVDGIYDIEPDIGSLATLTSAQIVTGFAQAAEAMIDARLALLYATPITSSRLLTALANNLTIYYILSRRVFTAQQLKTSSWPDRFKEDMATLDKIASGDIPLVDNSGVLIVGGPDDANAISNTMGYRPTFDEGRPEDWYQDSNKTDDINLSKF